MDFLSEAVVETRSGPKRPRTCVDARSRTFWSATGLHDRFRQKVDARSRTFWSASGLHARFRQNVHPIFQVEPMF